MQKAAKCGDNSIGSRSQFLFEQQINETMWNS